MHLSQALVQHLEQRLSCWGALQQWSLLRSPLQATTLLSDGRVFTIGGSWNGGIFIKDGEIWSSTTGWTPLPGCKVRSICDDIRSPARCRELWPTCHDCHRKATITATSVLSCTCSLRHLLLVCMAALV